jgi:tRNA pseudouridine13 synthase
MKLKSLPDDFEVEELSDFPLKGGSFAVYLLTKKSLGTPEAITAVAARWNIPRHAISYGGLKDKHAVTRQWVTIQRGPRHDLKQENFTLAYQGQADRSFGPHDIAANRFHVVMRNLTERAAADIVAQREGVARDGVPNYFDDQRFGSLGASGEFIAKPWCLGDYERALWLALAEANPHDRPGDKAEKETIRELWGKWIECKAALPKSSRRSIVTYLCDHPTRFREALALMRQDMRSLWLAAFQSDLWNLILSAWLQQHVDQSQLFSVPLATANVPFFSELTDAERTLLAGTPLPLPSARLKLEPGPFLTLYEQVLADEGLSLRELRVKYPRDAFFSKGERAALLIPRELRIHAGDDDVYPGRHRVTLQFVLPRGCYATILVKRLTGEFSETDPVSASL